MSTRPCGKTSLLSRTPDGTLIGVPMRCGSWDCEDCGPLKRKRLIKRLIAGNPSALMTLTASRRAHPSPYAAFHHLSYAINLLFKRLRRRYPGKEIQYALVWERTKKGWPHAHVLLRAPFLPQALISRLWTELAESPIVDIRAVTSNRMVVAYVSKYLSKAPDVPPHCRRFRTSRAYADAHRPVKLRETLGCGPFTPYAGPLSSLIQAVLKDGAIVETPQPWLLLGFYPPPGSSPPPTVTGATPKTLA